jgi:hypothetical protein
MLSRQGPSKAAGRYFGPYVFQRRPDTVLISALKSQLLLKTDVSGVIHRRFSTLSQR